jgi:hypothetical protein
MFYVWIFSQRYGRAFVFFLNRAGCKHPKSCCIKTREQQDPKKMKTYRGVLGISTEALWET